MIDSHCHLYDEKYDDILETAVDGNLTAIVNSCDSPAVFDKAKKMSENFGNLYFTAGIHPHNADKDFNSVRRIIDYLDHPKCLGIGEIGLDYFYSFSEKSIQKSVFEKQLQIACDYKKNIVVHSRNAENDIFDILKNIKNINILIHCYTGPLKILEQALSYENFFFSVGGMITFKNNENIMNILKIIPLPKLLIETDSPYLSPVPYRGKINMPSYIKYSYQKISEILDIDFGKFDKTIDDNFNLNFKF